MEINITLEQALHKASPRLQRLMRHSVDVLRRGEKLALLYDPTDGYWLGFSGGKDSQALIHIAQLAGVRFHAFFSPTSVDPPEVIRFIRREYPEVKFGRLKESIFKAFIRHKALPSMIMRWCCAEFKEKGGEGKVTLVGVRHSESTRRADRGTVTVSGHKFSGGFDEFDQWSEERRAKRERTLANKREKMRRAYEKGKITEEEYKQFDQFTQRGEQVVTCVGGRDKIVISPLLDWDAPDVWEFLNKVVEVPHCELYDQGWTRIGCVCCPMASPKNALRDIDRWPWVKEKWIQAIMQVRRERAKMGGRSSSARPLLGLWGGCTKLNGDRQHWCGFPNGDCGASSAAVAYREEEERQIAEAIFDWWISKKPYKKWYAERYSQKLDLDYGNTNGMDGEGY